MFKPIALLLTVALAACGSSQEVPGPTASPTPTPTPSPSTPSCAREQLEADFEPFAPMSGPGVDPASGKLLPPASQQSYVVSANYLALSAEPGAQAAFDEVVNPILAAFEHTPGLVAVQVGSSAACGTARTLAVWDSIDHMYDFVAAPEHRVAMQRVGEISRGGSYSTHWATTSTAGVTWAGGAAHLGTLDGAGI